MEEFCTGQGSADFYRILVFLGAFFRFLGSFFDFFTHLQPSCIFVVIFGDLSSIFGGLGRVLGRIFGGFFDEFLLDFRKRRFCKN